MQTKIVILKEKLQHQFSDANITCSNDEITLYVSPDDVLSTCQMLCTGDDLRFELLIDLSVVDYLHYGKDEWNTDSVTHAGFSRGIEAKTSGRLKFGVGDPNTMGDKPRFAVVYHLLSISLNQRLRIKVFAKDNDIPVIPSVTGVWPAADWYEREAFDLFGVLFEGHTDLRRILTDYGFIGHPFRKDFPLVGNVEMRYDPEKKRVIYEPVSIEPRVLVPKVIREDHRYLSAEESDDGNS